MTKNIITRIQCPLALQPQRELSKYLTLSVRRVAQCFQYLFTCRATLPCLSPYGFFGVTESVAKKFIMRHYSIKFAIQKAVVYRTDFIDIKLALCQKKLISEI